MNIQTNDQLADVLALMRVDTIHKTTLQSELDAELAKVHARYASKIQAKEDAVKAAAKAVQVYAAANRSDLVGMKSKSVTIQGHELGWRDNGGAVGTVKGVSEKKALERLLTRGRLTALFVSYKPSLDKEAIRRRWRQWKDKLMPLGFRIKHDEVFYIELDVTTDGAVKTAGKEAA